MLLLENVASTFPIDETSRIYENEKSTAENLKRLSVSVAVLLSLAIEWGGGEIDRKNETV